MLSGLLAGAQDKVYFLDGSDKSGKVTEIGPDYVILQTEDEAQTIYREKILLVEFKNGSTEMMNLPPQSRIYNPTAIAIKNETKNTGEFVPVNFFSVNTIALCNADISGFYERILPGKKIGLGIMGAYNFNLYATAPNLFIAVLSNAKKNYDLGAYLNIYTRNISERRTVFYYGLFVKYMNFRFSSVIEKKVTIGNSVSTNIKYRPAEGYQLATLLTCGTHTSIDKNFYIRSLFGLGGFNMHGEYREQYNYALNRAASQANPNAQPTTYNRKFLIKMYMGLHIGFNF